MVWLCKTKIWWKSKIVLYRYIFIVYIKTDDIYKDIAEDVETRFDTLNYELDRRLPKAKNKKLMKDDIGEKITTKFVGLRAKAYSYLIDKTRHKQVCHKKRWKL